MKHPTLALITTAWLLAAGPQAAAAPATARDMYTQAMIQERAVRDDAAKPTLAQMRRVVSAYENVVRRHPASGYADNALWQGANLASLAFDRFGDDADRKTAVRLYALLAKEYPASRLAAQANQSLAGLQAPALAAPPPVAPLPVAPRAPAAAAADTSAPAVVPVPGPSIKGVATLKDIKRSVLPDGIRLTVDIDAEISYYQEEISNPRRLFFDLKGVKAAPGLQDVALKFDDDVVKEVRLGRHPQNTTRLVVDIEGVSGYTVYPMYGPYRLVIDLRRAAAPGPQPSPAVIPPPVVEVKASVPLAVLPQVKKPSIPDTKSARVQTPLPAKRVVPNSLPPAAPVSNSNGKFSLSRQLGLGVSRIVIDAGHGGHDPGAHGSGINESELTLDVALRLQKLLQAQPGVEVVMTRDTDVFIPLEERIAIANREGADLFLSIHANASRNPAARGIETYFLNFAMNPEAEAVAARENATSAQSMHALPDIVKAIALNDKINESRDLAATVQKSMAKRLAARNRMLRDLGVKQAPFVVLIGAVMPSVLAEISFVTNKQDGALLKTGPYREQIAQALLDAILTYQQGLKRLSSVTGKKATEQ
jgi:N-acetylmuramoyl-L-alanine amidase